MTPRVVLGLNSSAAVTTKKITPIRLVKEGMLYYPKTMRGTRYRTFLVVLALLLPLSTPSATASEVTDIQNQLNTVSSNLIGYLSVLEDQRGHLVAFAGYIAEYEKCLVDNPGNQGCTDGLANANYQRNTVVVNAINEVNGYIARDNARLDELRTQLAAAQKREADAAAAALAAPENKLSESEIKNSVEKAKEIGQSLDWSIQQDTYFSTTTTEKLAETEKTLATLDQNSQAYKNLLEARAAYEVTLKTVSARLQDNASLKKLQQETIAALQSVQENTRAINLKDSQIALDAAAEFQKSLNDQVGDINVSITDINLKIADLATLLKRVAATSPEYASLLATKTDLEKALIVVETSKAEAEAQVKATQEAAAKAQEAQEEVAALEELRVETLPQRVEQVFAGQEIVEGEKVSIPVFKAKKLNSKFSQIRTKPIEGAESPVAEPDQPQVDMTAVESDELKGVKISLVSGKKVYKATGVTLNDDGTVSMKIPNSAKKGTYTMKIDLPETDDDPELKIKLRT